VLRAKATLAAPDNRSAGLAGSGGGDVAAAGVHFGPTPRAGTSDGGHAAGQSPRQLRVYADNVHLRVLPDAIELEREVHDGGPARLLLTDVPLAGHRQAATELAFAGRVPGSARMIVLDQATGAEIGRVEARLDTGETAGLAVPLHGVHALASIVFELAGPAEESGRRPVVCRVGRMEVL
jgi:hypothetical protein